MDILIEEKAGNLWAAALENNRLAGMEIDPAYEEVRWGSIYWAKIKTFDPAQDAAFIDLDGDNTGILYNQNVRLTAKDGAIKKGGAQPINKIFKTGDMVAVQAKNAYISHDSKDGESKLPSMSMDITLQGRYLIYCPMIQKNRISTRIRDKKLRKKLASMLNALADTKGCILRAAAANTQTDILRREYLVLQKSWTQIQKYLIDDDPGLIMLGPNAVERILSDQAGTLINKIEITTMDHFTLAEEWCEIFAPDLVTKIEPVELDNAEEDLALFYERDITGQIEDLFQNYILLPGGGNIIIQDTAALTAVDVNKGSDKRGHLSINIEAARELARQIRLRNIGGMIIVDFLRCKTKAEKAKLRQALEDAVNKDPCTVQIHGETALGLYELTRKRRTLPLKDRMSGPLD